MSAEISALSNSARLIPHSRERRKMGGVNEPHASQEFAERWLDKHGVALEMQVAASLRRNLPDEARHLRVRVEHARTYVDRDFETNTQKLREVDVVATITNSIVGRTVGVRLVIECKSSAKVPWLLYRGSAATQVPKDVGGRPTAWRSWASEGESVDRIGNVLAMKPPYLLGAEETCYGVASATDGANAKNEAQDALRQVISATDGIANDADNSSGFPTVYLLVPVVVTRAPLFTVTLKDDGPEVRATTRELVYGRFSANDDLRAVWVMRESEVEPLAALAQTFVHRLDYRA